MVYLKYRKKDGYVVAVLAEAPTDIEEEYDIVEAEGLRVGSEFEFVIYIDPKEIKDGKVRSHYAVRMGPPQEEMMKKINQVEAENKQRIEKVEDDIKSIKEK